MYAQYRRRIGVGVVLALLAFTSGVCEPASASRPPHWAKPVASDALRNWYQVDENLYRSGQPDRKGFEEARAKGIKTVINLRTAHSDMPLVDGLGLFVMNVPMTAGGFVEEDIVKALAAIQAAPKPVLIHCQHGSDRTGLVAAMYRIIFQGWTKEEALSELKRGGFGFHGIYINIPAFIRDVDPLRIRKRLAAPKPIVEPSQESERDRPSLSSPD